MHHDRNCVANTDVFRQIQRVTLADVLLRVEENDQPIVRRDTRSAFRVLETRLSVSLRNEVASTANLRRIFGSASPASLGIGDKRWANVRSAVSKAVERYGQKRTWITREISLAAEWRDLLSRIECDRQYRWGLNRLACYCSVKAIAPTEVSRDTLRGLFEALEAEAVSKDPRNLLKRTIACWNHCRKTVPGWPEIRLSSPFASDPAMMPLDAFPEEFQRDVAAWEARMRSPDPLDPDAPIRAFRPDTLKSYHFTFRRLASALVSSGTLGIDDVTGLHVFFKVEVFKAAIRPFLVGGRIKTEGYAHKMATQMIAVGRHFLKLDTADLKPIMAIAGRLKPRTTGQMGERNRVRLEQFDDGAKVARLLRFPEEELARALTLRNALRRAKGVERALAISLAIFSGLRVKNLRELTLDGNIRPSGKRVFVRIPAKEAKTRSPLELELPKDTIDLLDLFLANHRHVLPGAEGRYLFPGAHGGARSYSAMRDALGRPLHKYAGIKMSPHLYRHVIAKIIVERHPELALDVSRRLGHKSINTTYQSYLGTEGPAASRRINALLSGYRDENEADA